MSLDSTPESRWRGLRRVATLCAIAVAFALLQIIVVTATVG